MTTHSSFHQFVEQVHEAMQLAQGEYMLASYNAFHNKEDFHSAQNLLETALHDLQHIHQSCDVQQREELHRLRAQLLELQHKMITDSH